MKKNKSKKIIAAIMALSMIASTQLPTISAVFKPVVYDFEDGVALPWHICEGGTAVLNFDISDGEFHVEIVNPGGIERGGDSRWDAQFRCRGFQIKKGHKYEVKFDLASDTTGDIYTKIGDLGGNVEVWNGDKVDGQKSWDFIHIAAGETIEFDAVFTADETVEVAEWAFQFGGSGQYSPNDGKSDCFPEGTNLYFDNLSLSDLTEMENALPNHSFDAEHNDIAVNQLGYFPDLAKQATISFFNGSDSWSTPIDERTPVDEKEPKKWVLKNSAGEIVKEGTSTYKGFDKESGNYVHIIDFSDFTTEGTGFYLECNNKKSYPFMISNDLYGNLFNDSLNFFYQQRAEEDIISKYITSGDKSLLARPKASEKDIAYVQHNWVSSYSLDGSDIDVDIQQDVSGGWYNSSYGKDVIEGGGSLWMLNNIYEKALANGKTGAYADGKLLLPENANDYPDILDEARFEMEWLLKMRVMEGEKTDMAYTKVTPYKWSGLGVTPAESYKFVYRIIKPASTSATLALAACGAQSYRLWKDIDPDFANECLDAAVKAYAAAIKYPDLSIPLDYNKPAHYNYIAPSFEWAAIELYLATGDSSYIDNAKDSIHYLECPTAVTGGENVGEFASFDSENCGALGTLSLVAAYRNGNKNVTEEMYKTACDNIQKAADVFIEKENEQGYGIPFESSEIRVDSRNGGYNEYEGYVDDSNSYVLNNAMIMGYAYLLSSDTKYLSGASTAMDYLFGRNPVEYSYVTGYGDKAVENIHYPAWAYSLFGDLPKAPSGVVAGGPSTLPDPMMRLAGFVAGENAPQVCYLDDCEAWAVNECDVLRNAPLTWMASLFNDTYSSKAVSETIYGDLNFDGDVTASDVIAFINHYLGTGKLGTQALINADVTADGEVDLRDLATLKQFIMGDKVGGGRLVR